MSQASARIESTSAADDEVVGAMKKDAKKAKISHSNQKLMGLPRMLRCGGNSSVPEYACNKDQIEAEARSKQKFETS